MAGTVVVACKIPNGLFLDVLGHDRIKVHGPAKFLTQESRHPIIHGVGLTTVDADLWAVWSKAHASYGPVKAGLIFAHEKSPSVEAQAREMLAEKSGLEPLEKPAKDGQHTDPRLKGMKELEPSSKE